MKTTVAAWRSMATMICASTAAVLFTASCHGAVVWNVLGGKLVGAENVEVNGSVFDVSFVDGTCLSIAGFNGCNADTDFAFTTSADALAAAQALLNQVYVDAGAGAPDDYDTEPERINGCEEPSGCISLIPYGIQEGTFTVFVAWAENTFDSLGLSDGTSLNEIANNSPTSSDLFNYAVFTPSAMVPVPAGIYLMLSTWPLVMACRRRRVAQRTQA